MAPKAEKKPAGRRPVEGKLPGDAPGLGSLFKRGTASWCLDPVKGPGDEGGALSKCMLATRHVCPEARGRGPS